MKYGLTIGYLYQELMNTYGDHGNMLALKRRLNQRSIDVVVKCISIGDQLKPGICDMYLIGGGQNNAQAAVARDLVRKADTITTDIENGVVCLAVCGGYQLFGKSYTDGGGREIAGIGVFSVSTKAGPKRMVGPLLIATDLVPSGRMIGFENHSGQTILEDPDSAFGRVIHGFGNNGQDRSEGIRYKNAFGTYLHGSLLPNNPAFADYLIELALKRQGINIQLPPLDDTVEKSAFTEMLGRLKTKYVYTPN